MIRDIDDVDEEVVRADICIIGSGAAGLTLAAELDGGPGRVLVLESGRRSVDTRTQALYRTDLLGLAHEGVHDLRFRVFGGTTTRWAGQAMPLLDIDFERRSWVPASGWPIRRDDLEPDYRSAAALLGIPTFPRRPTDAWPPALPAAPAFDPDLLAPAFSAFSARPDFSQTLGPILERSPHVEVLLGANVTELVPDATATAVTTAIVRSFSGRIARVEADVFVVACGGIDSARLLLASGNRDDGGIGNAGDLVGRCFQDHPGFVVGPIVGSGVRRLRRTFAARRSRGVKFLPRIALGEALQRRERLLHGGGTIVFDLTQPQSLRAGKELYHAARDRDVRRATGNLRIVLRDPVPVARAAARYFVRRQPALDSSGPPLLAVGCEQLPNRESRVQLADERDELGMRRASLDWRLTEAELGTVRRTAEVTAGELERLGFGDVDLDAFRLPDDPADLSGIVIDAGHHMGTTRMATTAEDGVVDADLRVHGVDNLYVASTSVFPTSGVSNPTFTLLALCVRLARRLRAETHA